LLLETLATTTATSDKGSQVVLILIGLISFLLAAVVVTIALGLLLRSLRKNRTTTGTRSDSVR
jgi:hypothetical protein